MNNADPFSQPGNWFKGCLHVHSAASDGKLTPDEVIDWYRRRGYHFLALTDHRVGSEALSVDADFVTLSGIELDGTDTHTGLYHVVGLAPARPAALVSEDNYSMQDAVNRLRAAGALVAIAHPYWSGQMSKDLLDIEGCFALEIYNTGCEVEDAKGFSTVHWDDLLAAGRKLWGIAVDDAHWRHGANDAGQGWVWVKAPVLTQEAILQALERGHFYASCGPRIHSVVLDGTRVLVRCSASSVVDFVGDGHRSQRVTAAPGETLTEASAWLRWQQRYVRVACQDPEGRWAWSNPIFL
jgi:predicted metal-dependent phosphoesterase TrpH